MNGRKNSSHEIRVSIPPDDQGFIGRECPVCELYFKVKPGTGLPVQVMYCPYCLHKEPSSKFFTKDQVAYIRSVAVKTVVDPLLRDFHNGLKKMEFKGDFISIKVSSSRPVMKIHSYGEQNLETSVTCDNCKLQFSIYGVFANCPDCQRLNARVIFDKSLEAARKRIAFSSDSQIDDALRQELLRDAMTSAVSSFDSLGKALRERNPSLLPPKPRNLFQNLSELETALNAQFQKDLSAYVSADEKQFLLKMFQVRHIYEHNMGVVDDDCAAKVPEIAALKGRKYLLQADEITRFVDTLRNLAHSILNDFPN